MNNASKVAACLLAAAMLGACSHEPPAAPAGHQAPAKPAQMDHNVYCAGHFAVQLPPGVLAHEAGRSGDWITVKRIDLLGQQLSDVLQQRAAQLAGSAQLISRVEPLEGGTVFFYWQDAASKTTKLFESYVVANGEDTVYHASDSVYIAGQSYGYLQDATLAGMINSSIEALNGSENPLASQRCVIEAQAH